MQAVKIQKLFFSFFALIPLVVIVFRAANDGLGADPAKALVSVLGFFSLCGLLLTLSLTPLRLLTSNSRWIAFRRMAGLFTMLYASLHVCAYVVFLFELKWGRMLEEVLKRPFITVGFAAFILLIPLAITSTKKWRRRLGAKWVRLHKLVYPAAVLALIHQVWVQKSDYSESVIFLLVLASLFFIRFFYKYKQAS